MPLSSARSPRNPHRRSTGSAALFLGLLAVEIALPARGAGASPEDDAPAGGIGATKTHTITVYELWGSAEKSREKPPKALEKLVPTLRKHTGRNSFRLVTKPVVRKVRLEETFMKKLPQKYLAAWTLTKLGDKLALRQKLTNPRKRSSVLLLRKSPVITELTRIRQGSESFILVVDFGPAKKG